MRAMHQRIFLTTIIAASFATALPTAAQADTKWFPGHYTRGVSKWHIQPVENVREIRGFVVDVWWEEIEPQPNQYRFGVIDNAVRTAQSRGKKLIIRLPDWKSHGGNPGLPKYMLASQYGGGYYTASDRSDRGTMIPKSYPKGWLKSYQDRWNKYLAALGRRYDKNPTIAAICFVESSRVPPKNDRTWSPSRQVDFFKSQNSAAAKAFPSTPVIQYLNFMPQIPKSLRDSVPTYIVQTLGNGIGSPDVINYSRGGRGVLSSGNFRDAFVRYKNKAPLLVEAQSGAFRGGTARNTLNYGVDQVGANFFLWVTGKRSNSGAGYTIQQVVNELKATNGKINRKCPYRRCRLN